MEVVARQGDILFVNDSKATNAAAAAHALAAYENIFWIAGGIAKQGGIDALAPYFANITRAVLIGEAAESFAEKLGAGLVHELSGDLTTAVRAAHENAVAAGGGVVLLSPACASFDQFASFEARGDQFHALAQSMIGDGDNGDNGEQRRAVGGLG
jgi:UDP-N-acetylmuramoylalanine--D-glutamate ligase